MFSNSGHWDAVLSSVVDVLQLSGRIDAAAVLLAVNESNVALVPGARYASITVLNGAGSVSTLAATDRRARWIDDVQRATKEGPCLSAAWNQHIIHIADLATEDRWPQFCETALRRSAVRSVLSFRLFNHGKLFAALNFHAESAGAFDDESIKLGLLAAARTTIVWNIINRERQFRTALTSRDIIGQAKGVLMERFGIDADEAFDLLKQLSQESNIKLVDIAARLVRGDP